VHTFKVVNLDTGVLLPAKDNEYNSVSRYGVVYTNQGRGLNMAKPTERLTELFDQYDTIIRMMPKKKDFSSHEFILKLAKHNQRAYIEALHLYKDRTAPFDILHGLLAKELKHHSSLVEHTKVKYKSQDIFNQHKPCSWWARIP
jgi:hypothetical protein